MEKEEARVKAAHVRGKDVRRAQEDISIVCFDTGATTPKDKAEGAAPSKSHQHSKGARLVAIGNLPGMVVRTTRLASFASLRSFACGMFVITVNDFQKRRDKLEEQASGKTTTKTKKMVDDRLGS
jgi:hypothetical protein